jgi:hypothetical protein
MRRRLALELLSRQDWAGAVEHLRWCAAANQADRLVADKLSWANLQLRASSVQPASNGEAWP